MTLTKTKHHLYFSFFISLLLAQGMFFLGIKYSLGADSLAPTEAFTISWSGSTNLDIYNHLTLRADTNREAQSLSFEIRNNDNTSISSGLLGAVSNPTQNLKREWSREYTIPEPWSNGNYTIYIRAVPLGMAESTNAVEVTQLLILNRTATIIRWMGSESVGSDNGIVLQAQTSREVQSLSFEIKKDDNTLSSGLLTAISSISLNTIWSKNYYFPDTWPDGTYTIYIKAIPLSTSENTSTVVVTQPFFLNRQVINSQFVGGDLSFIYDSTMSGEQTLELKTLNWSLQDYTDISVLFKVYSGSTIANYLPAYKLDSVTQKIIANFDTSRVANGSYKICASVTLAGQEKYLKCGPLVQITNTENIIPKVIKLYLNEGVSLKSGDKLYASSNFINPDQLASKPSLSIKTFKINGTSADPTPSAYTGTMSAIACGSNDVPVAIRENIVQLGHDYCWQAQVPAENSLLSFASGSGSVLAGYGQLTSGLIKVTFISSDSSIENNQNIEEASDVLLKINNNFVYGVDERSIMFYIMSNIDNAIRNVFYIENSKGELISDYTFSKMDWAQTRILKEDYPATPYLYFYYVDISKGVTASLKDGEYNAYAKILSLDNKDVLAESNKVFFQVKDGKAINSNQPTGTKDSSELEQNKEIISFATKNSCSDFAVYDETICQQFLAIIGNQINEQCLRVGIYNDLLCENYLLEEQVKKECTDQGVMDSQACQDLLLEKYVSTVECRLDDQELCFKTLREKYLNRLVSATNQQSRISSSTESMIGQVWALETLSARLEESKIDVGILPLLPNKETKVLLARSNQRTILETTEQLTVLQNVVMIVDDDADGLSNDMERYYGTDINNPDSDGDTKSDGLEVAGGFNPLGEGLLTQERSNLDKIVSSGSSLEQPTKFSKNIDEQLQVTLTQNENKTVRLVGVAAANTWINIFVYSDLPLVMTTKTDASGNWTYDVQNSLVDGGHQVYVTVNDDTGNVVKQSNPISFLVKSAQAVTVEQYFDTNTSPFVASDGILWDYILAVAVLMIVGIIFIFILYKHNKSQKEKFND